MYVHVYYTRCTCGCVSVCLYVSLTLISLSDTHTHTHAQVLSLLCSTCFALLSLYCLGIYLLSGTCSVLTQNKEERTRVLRPVLSCPKCFTCAVHSCL